MFKKIFLLTPIFSIIFISLHSQNAGPCQADSLYHALDFWVGDWEVFDQNDRLVGYNKIEKILNSCAIQENWTDTGGNEGKSLFYVENDSRQWKQVWVTASAKQPWGQKEKSLLSSTPGKEVLFQGSYKMQGQLILDRTILSKGANGHVKQTIQVSRDGGQNWQTTFIGIYKKK